MVDRFRRAYGGSPLHLLALLASLLIAAAAVAGWFDSFTTSDTVRILIWFLGAILAHDLVLLPLYSLLDRIASGTLRARDDRVAPQAAGDWVYVRVPALLSGLLCHVNLIPLNPEPSGQFSIPRQDAIARFAAIVQESGLPCTVRVDRGQDIAAACGQLARAARGPNRQPLLPRPGATVAP